MQHIGVLHVLASQNLNEIVELVPAERHAECSDRPHGKWRRRFEEATIGTAVQDSDANVPRQCCQHVAALPRIFKSSNHRFSRPLLRLSEPHQPQLVKHLSVSYDGSAGNDSNPNRRRCPACKCFERQHLVHGPRFAIYNDKLSVRCAPH
jgi:hypothetical protein